MSVIQKYQPREVPFTSWLLRVARNVSLDICAGGGLPCEEVHEPTREHDDAGRDRRWGIEQALAALPEEQREVVIMRHLVGLTPERSPSAWVAPRRRSTVFTTERARR